LKGTHIGIRVGCKVAGNSIINMSITVGWSEMRRSVVKVTKEEADIFYTIPVCGGRWHS